MSDLDPTGTRYLLGEMTDAERDACEEDYLADDQAHELLRATEDDLFDAYAAGRLDPERRRRFESRFLREAAGRERLAIAQALGERSAASPPAATTAPGWFGRVRGRMWAIPFALAAAAIILVVARSARDRGPSRSEREADAPPPVVFALVSATRGAPQVLAIPDGTREVRLEPEVPASIERATLRHRGRIVPTRTEPSGVVVDAAALLAGPHVLEVAVHGDAVAHRFEFTVDR